MAEKVLKLSDQKFSPLYKTNPDFDIMNFNFHDENAVGRLKLGKDKNGLKELMAYQRLLRIHHDEAIANTLLKNGFDSAHKIAFLSEAHFIKKHANLFGNDNKLTETIHKSACSIAAKTAHLWANVQSIVASRHFRSMNVNNVHDDISNFFENMPSYQDLFGNLDYCKCEYCKSIFSPAAYLVDLMRIIDKYITEANKETVDPKLMFNARRPDIGKIALTCNNTNNIIPYLQIVCEVLECWIKTDLVTDDIYKTFARIYYPFNTPFNLPLNKIRVYLADSKIILSDIFKAFNWNKKDYEKNYRREYLDISIEELNLFVNSSISKKDDLIKYYGVNGNSPNFGGLTDEDTFIFQTGLSKENLHELLYQNLNPTELGKDENRQITSLACDFYINKIPGSSNWVEIHTQADGSNVLTNIEYPVLDRMNRFIRLAKKLKWSFTDTDWILNSIIKNGNDIGSDTITQLAKICRLNEKLNQPLNILSSLWSDIKTAGVGNGISSEAPFDIIFNSPDILKQGLSTYTPKYRNNPLYKDDLKSWAIDKAKGIESEFVLRIASSLEINADDLLDLGIYLFGDGNKIELSVENLSALYRHAKLASLIKWDIKNYLRLLEFVFGLEKNNVLTYISPENALYIINIVNYLNEYNINMYKIDYICNGNTNIYVNVLYNEGFIPQFLMTLWKYSENIPDEDNNERKESLRKELIEQLANFYGQNVGLIECFIDIVPKKTKPVIEDYIALFFTQFELDPKKASASDKTKLDNIRNFIKALSQYLVLTANLKLDHVEADNIVKYSSCYNITDIFNITIKDIQELLMYMQLKEKYLDTRYLLASYFAETEKDKKIKLLAELTSWDIQNITKLINRFWPEEISSNENSYNSIEGIIKLKECFEISVSTNLSIDSLTLLAGLDTLQADEKNWITYEGITASVFSTLKSKYTDEIWDSVNMRLRGQVEDKKIDVLRNYVLWKLHKLYPDINNMRNVYEFFMIDVQMAGCSQISYIKEALNACQLYLQRCRLNLEKGINEIDIPGTWWEWIMHYREWEANRKVFLYPENYIQPELRKSKTSLFNELETTLLQSNITSENVEKAYSKYLEELSNLANLKYIDAYYSTISYPDIGLAKILFLFARTEKQPYIYYYCSQKDGVTWTEWEKIDITINSSHISPVYAFDKLFIFWVEFTKTAHSQINTNDSKINSQNNIEYKISIKYTFYNFSKEWVQPQTLVKDHVIYLSPDNYFSTLDSNQKDLFKGFFNMDSLFWNKIYALRIVPENYEIKPFGLLKNEKIAIFYGPFIDEKQDAKNLSNPIKPTLDENNPGQYDFEKNIYAAINNYNRVIEANSYGEFLLENAIILNSNLENDYILKNNEFILLPTQDFSKINLPAFKPEINLIDSEVNIIKSNSIIHDNYFGDIKPEINNIKLPSNVNKKSFVTDSIDETRAEQVYFDLLGNNIINEDGVIEKHISTKTNLSFLFEDETAEKKAKLIREVREILFAHAGSPLVFANIASNSKTIVVKNKCDWFIFNDGDEAYLLKASNKSFDEITNSLKINKSLGSFSKKSFIVGGLIDESGSGQIYKDLLGNNIISIDGVLDKYFSSDTDISFLCGGDPYLIRIVRNILLDLSPVKPEFFVTENIGLSLAQQIFADLKGNNIVDGNGRLDALFNSKTDLSFLFAGEDEQRKSNLIKQVKSILLNLASVTSLRYDYKPKDCTVRLDSFILHPYIDRIGSEQVYNDLLGNNIINSEGIINRYFNSTTDLSFLFSGEDEDTKNELISLIRGILIQFYESTWVADILDINFSTERITTSVSGRLSQTLFKQGINGLLSLYFQQIPVVPIMPFDRLEPASIVKEPENFDGAQVDFKGPYGLYYQELFFHTPFLVANNLSSNFQFSDAQKWLQYIFNPTIHEKPVDAVSFITKDLSMEDSQKIFEGLRKHKIIDDNNRIDVDFNENTDLSFLFENVKDSKLKELLIREVRNVLLNYYLIKPVGQYWRYLPFRNHKLEELKQILLNPVEISEYNNYPYDPHAIARLRIGAYEKAIVMKYIDNLLDWGDYYFSQYTWESNTTATLLYVYAYDLLGNRPEQVGICNSSKEACYEDIKKLYPDGVPQFFIDMEHLVKNNSVQQMNISGIPFNNIGGYFCAPENDIFVGYWDRVEDRLYKIRHCLNIEGIEQQLELFQPPLNPMDLVKAKAAGNNMIGLITGAGNNYPYYRFSYMIEKTKNIISTLIQFGTALLSALEKADSEELNLLRSTHEENILNLSTALKENQLEELKNNLDGLFQSQQSAKFKIGYFSGLIDKGISNYEETNLEAMRMSLIFSSLSGAIKTLSSIGYAVPQIGSPFSMNYGGKQLGSVLTASSGVLDISAGIYNYKGQASLTMAGYQRREKDWKYQKQLAQYEYDQITKQIDSVNTRIKSAQRELEIHKTSIEQAKSIKTFLTSKFSSKDLYKWMSCQLSALYFQTYKIALEIASAAQSTYQHELERNDSYINFGSWDNLRKGLLAGEGLMLSINRLEKAYIDNNRRPLEIEKTISLLRLAPEELLDLKTYGKCNINLEESLFDYDFPGHYCRKIKSISISIPAVVGPYQNIKATLTQTKNSILTEPDTKGVAYLFNPQNDPPGCLRIDWRSNQQIAISKGIDDNGMFVLNFNDERYLPFEGTGVVSAWELNMPKSTNRIDFDSLSDVIIKLNYTALEGGRELYDYVTKNIATHNPFSEVRYFNLQQSFSSEWRNLLKTLKLSFSITDSIILPNVKNVKLSSVYFKIDVSSDIKIPDESKLLNLMVRNKIFDDIKIKSKTVDNSTEYYAQLNFADPISKDDFIGQWIICIDKSEAKKIPLMVNDDTLDPNKLLNIETVLQYSADIFNN